MYTIKEPNLIQFAYGQNKKIARQIGLAPESLCNILNGRHSTKYTTAYCIVKMYDAEAEVLDFFKKSL